MQWHRRWWAQPVVRDGDVALCGEGRAGAVAQPEVTVVTVSDKDFDAVFDGTRWTVRWSWKDGAPTLQNQCYKISAGSIAFVKSDTLKCLSFT